MNLRSELLEIFAPEVGHALSISSWDRLEEWMKRKLADNQPETVERLRRDLETPPPDVQEKVIKMLDLVSRDALKEAEKQARDVVLPFLEQRLTEAQADMVERCANRVDAYRGVAQKQTAWTWGEVNNLLVDLREQVRALSPDPHARERWERTAYIEGVKSVYVQHDHAIAGVCGAACPLKLRDLRVAELERQLGTLSAVTL